VKVGRGLGLILWLVPRLTPSLAGVLPLTRLAPSQLGALPGRPSQAGALPRLALSQAGAAQAGALPRLHPKMSPGSRPPRLAPPEDVPRLAAQRLGTSSGRFRDDFRGDRFARERLVDDFRKTSVREKCQKTFLRHFKDLFWALKCLKKVFERYLVHTRICPGESCWRRIVWARFLGELARRKMSELALPCISRRIYTKPRCPQNVQKTFLRHFKDLFCALKCLKKVFERSLVHTSA